MLAASRINSLKSYVQHKKSLKHVDQRFTLAWDHSREVKLASVAEVRCMQFEGGSCSTLRLLPMSIEHSDMLQAKCSSQDRVDSVADKKD